RRGRARDASDRVSRAAPLLLIGRRGVRTRLRRRPAAAGCRRRRGGLQPALVNHPALTKFAMLSRSDIGESYRSGDSTTEAAASGWDTIYVPDKNSTPFVVIFVERTGHDFKRAYSRRAVSPSWRPTFT